MMQSPAKLLIAIVEYEKLRQDVSIEDIYQLK